MNETFEQHPAFTIVRRLAVGGMGEVLLARFVGNEHVGPGLVVVKRTLTDHPNRDYQDQMLREEGRVAVRLRHANLVETYAMDELGGHPLLVMELLAGRSMAQVLGNAKRAKTPTPVGVALQVLHGAACGLHFAHTLRVGGQPLGLVHRDVSPANIFVTYDGKVKVIDFGVAKAQDSEIKTSTGILKGKLGYMSPEHAKGETLDPRADVWSLGVVLWESLVTDRLFGGQNPAMTLFQITQAPQDPPSVRRPDVPPEVDALCMRLLAKDREQRFASCAEVVRAIEQLPPSLWRDTDVGAFLSQRFPDDAASGQQELAERARMVRPRPIPAGILESEVIPESDESQVATLIADGSALVRQALAQSALQDPPHTPASVIPRSPVLHSADANKTVALKLSDVPLAAAATTSSLSGHPGDTLADIPVVPQRAPSLSPSFASSPPSLASPPAPSFASPPAPSFAPPPAPSFAPPPAPSFAPPPAPSFAPPPAPSFAPPPAPSFAPPALPPAKPHPHGPSSLTIGLLAFGLMAMLAGGVFGQLREAREQAPSLLVYQTKGKLDAIVALAEDAREPQDQLYSLGWPEPRLMLIAGGPREAVQPQALQRELTRAGIWQRALVPRTLRQRISALMPLAVFLLGALALSLSLPALRLRGASRAIGSAVMLLVTSGGAALLLQGGGLGWPGFEGQKVQEVVQPLAFQMVTNVPSMQEMPPDRSAPLARAILEARLALLRGKPQEALGVLGPVATPTLRVPEVFALLGDANVDLGRDGLAEGHYLRYLELASSARDRGTLEAWLKQSH